MLRCGALRKIPGQLSPLSKIVAVIEPPVIGKALLAIRLDLKLYRLEIERCHRLFNRRKTFEEARGIGREEAHRNDLSPEVEALLFDFRERLLEHHVDLCFRDLPEFCTTGRGHVLSATAPLKLKARRELCGDTELLRVLLDFLLRFEDDLAGLFGGFLPDGVLILFVDRRHVLFEVGEALRGLRFGVCLEHLRAVFDNHA